MRTSQIMTRLMVGTVFAACSAYTIYNAMTNAKDCEHFIPIDNLAMKNITIPPQHFNLTIMGNPIEIGTPEINTNWAALLTMLDFSAKAIELIPEKLGDFCFTYELKFNLVTSVILLWLSLLTVKAYDTDAKLADFDRLSERLSDRTPLISGSNSQQMTYKA
jgi:hypothetical protein